MKAFPTDEEIAEADEMNAGTYLRNLAHNDTAAYEELLATRAPDWGQPPLQPVHRCVDHLMCVLIVECQRGRTDEMNLSEKEVKDFFTSGGVSSSPAGNSPPPGGGDAKRSGSPTGNAKRPPGKT